MCYKVRLKVMKSLLSYHERSATKFGGLSEEAGLIIYVRKKKQMRA
jgi:hypothetical protein